MKGKHAILIQKSSCRDSIISNSNSTASLRRLFQQHRPTPDSDASLDFEALNLDNSNLEFSRSFIAAWFNRPHAASAAATEGVPMSEDSSDEKVNAASTAGKVEITRRRLLGSSSLIAASAVASAALPRSAASQDGNVLPKPESPFAGKTGRTVRDS